MRYQPSGVERLGPLPPVVALHQERAPQPQLADLAGAAQRSPRLGIDHLRLEPGRGPTERAPPVLGLVGLVVGRARQTLPASVMPEHRVAQLGIGGRDVAAA